LKDGHSEDTCQLELAIIRHLSNLH